MIRTICMSLGPQMSLTDISRSTAGQRSAPLIELSSAFRQVRSRLSLFQTERPIRQSTYKVFTKCSYQRPSVSLAGRPDSQANSLTSSFASRAPKNALPPAMIRDERGTDSQISGSPRGNNKMYIDGTKRGSLQTLRASN